MHFLILLAFFASAQARAVNISNTWVLPEEGFPVFYRYFRDRISWYEADAVCQFHHANLVTVDTTAQYDAVRAYLKELDISSGVWVGLIRSNPEGDFTWTDYRGLSGDGYWSSAPDPRTAPLCAAADPTEDYRWEARACGGPTVASFICELPVPQWALGKEGCMVRALPALTILYLPESAAVQLTADCGLAGVKRVQCTGNVKREDLLRDLSCAEEVESTSLNNLTLNITITETTTSTENQELSSISVTEENMSIEHDNGHGNLPSSVMSTPIPFNENVRQSTISELPSTSQPIHYEMNKVILEKNINLNDMQNNLQSNDIPNLVNNDNFLTNYRIQKLEDEENMQHKKLHDELARLGNFETIFTQPTDHFVPPLVMAKARISDDMNVLSLKEKHAQHFGMKDMIEKENEESKVNLEGGSEISTEPPHITESTVVLITEGVTKLKDNVKKNISLLKKYKDLNTKIPQISKSKTKKVNKETITEITNESKPTFVKTPLEIAPTSTLGTTVVTAIYESQNDSNIDLTVILRETDDERHFSQDLTNGTDDGIVKNTTRNLTQFVHSTTEIIDSFNGTQLNVQETQEKLNKSGKTLEQISTNSSNGNDINISETPQTLDFTTKLPIFKDEIINMPTTNFNISIHDDTNKTVFTTTEVIATIIDDIQISGSNSSIDLPSNTVDRANYTEITESSQITTKPESPIINSANQTYTPDHETTLYPVFSDAFNYTETVEEIDERAGDLETIDDFQSPLLSGANEPLQRPNRSRRPKQPNRVNKFNPFRILG
ncbi:PREDICTED: uncharacterized protein LOC106099547 [Papilio polytes]|uniref:uncharacterized protein LOC106099547 n=1 Tax=Papilio polytes TaxID=76194 RepID=UPI000675FDF9|nr:PREDICTED: uncharacterized protein LOC106099547 [Papilio polytes]